ncbi:hypothetical protein KAT51_08685 [bacterium]|nr:hypothetical protein [bacterium]
MYCRIELETTEEKFFLSPHVFGLEDGIKKLSRLGWLTQTKPGKKKGKLRLIPIRGHWPREVLWHLSFEDESTQKHGRRIRQAEHAWARHWEREERRDGTVNKSNAR